MKRGLSLCAFGTNLPDVAVLRFSKELGFEYVEGNAYSSQELVDAKGNLHLDEALELYAAAGVRVHSMHGPCVDLSSPEDEERSEGVRLCLAALEALHALGGSILVMHPAWPRDPDVPTEVRRQNSVESLKMLDDRCTAKGVRLAIENLLPVEGFSGSEEVLEIAQRVGETVGICFDSCHASLTGEGLASMIEALAPHVIATHLSDSFLKDNDHYPPGLGRQDLVHVIEKLGTVGYEGVYNFELDVLSPKRLVAAVGKWMAASVEPAKG